MGFKDITAGEKTAQARAARFIESKNGTKGIEIAFEFKQGDNVEHLNFVGWLSPNALQNTMDTLVHVLGFNGDDSHDSAGVLTNPNAIAYGKDVQIVVERETYIDKDGNEKDSPKIKWVNKVASSRFEGCSIDTIKSDFKAAFLAAKQAAPSSPAQAAQKPMADIPF